MGKEHQGGKSAMVQDQLKNIQQIHTTERAFAAILADGSVVTWGNPDWVDNSASVSDKLRNVQQIHATERAVAAILADGSVVTWGDPYWGGNSSTVRDQFKYL